MAVETIDEKIERASELMLQAVSVMFSNPKLCSELIAEAKTLIKEIDPTLSIPTIQ